jgi:hypothetical protein
MRKLKRSLYTVQRIEQLNRTKNARLPHNYVDLDISFTFLSSISGEGSLSFSHCHNDV